ncbi:MAG: acyltransferase, partial [Phenylobacterium sp.]|nr:acyltransferase [Phenylobacterium sp.]
MTREDLPTWAGGTGTIPGLDGLRAISILIVVGSHLVTHKIPGGLGVYVFFVISGFLIAHLMFSEVAKTGRVSLRKFYFRRALRLYPALTVYVLVTAAYCVAIGFNLTGLDVGSALLYFANYHRSRPYGIVWSLSVEEHFYFLFPSAMVLLRANPKAVIAAAAAVCLGCLALRTGVALAHPELVAADYFYPRTEYRLDAIAYGVLIAATFRTEWGRALLYRVAHPLITAAALLVVILCLVNRDLFFRETVRYSLLGLSIAVVVVGVLFRPTAPSKLLNWAPLVWIGQLSYSLYLWHAFVRLVFETRFPGVRTAYFSPLLITASIAVAALSYYGLERPVQ